MTNWSTLLESVSSSSSCYVVIHILHLDDTRDSAHKIFEFRASLMLEWQIYDAHVGLLLSFRAYMYVEYVDEVDDEFQFSAIPFFSLFAPRCMKKRIEQSSSRGRRMTFTFKRCQRTRHFTCKFYDTNSDDRKVGMSFTSTACVLFRGSRGRYQRSCRSES